MDIGGDCGIVLLVLMIVTAVARVAALIRINLFYCVFGGGICGICSNCGGICCLASGISSDGNSDYGDLLFPTTTITTTTNIPTTTTALHTLRYGTFGDGGNSGFGWVLMLVVVMVGFFLVIVA